MVRGAPRQFDRTEALEQAMLLFWEKGYDSVGMTELTEQMGIGRQSVYNTFGDKKALYLAALEHYLTTELGECAAWLEGEGSPLGCVRRVLKEYEKLCTSGDGMGCMMVNAITDSISYDPEVRALIQASMKRYESVFRATFERAKAAGEIDPAANSLSLTRGIMALGFGVTVLVRAGASPAVLRDAMKANTMAIDSVTVKSYAN